MESFIEEYISSVDVDGVNINEEFLLERRVSPYATLRPGDLASLLKLHTSLPFLGTGNCKLGHDVEEILKTEQEAAPECGEEEEALRTVVCRGADQGHVPAVYTVQGLRQHEFPVVGVFVDERICPGFRYRVRRVGSTKYFYGNEPRTLESIGMGYGKRLTFTGKTKNNNECYFWSDSEPSGFAFSIHAVDDTHKFSVLDSEDTIVAEGVVTQVHEQQEETAMAVSKDGITKWVNVTLTCAMTYHNRHHHGLMDMMAHEDTETFMGSAVLRKARRSRKAELVAVENVFLQRLGNCTLIPDS